MKPTKNEANNTPGTIKQTPEAAIKQVIQWILEANSERDISEAIAAKFPGANQKTAIETAVKEIIAIGKEDPAFTRGWALAATKELTRKMIEVGDFANALRGIKQASQLAGTAGE